MKGYIPSEIKNLDILSYSSMGYASHRIWGIIYMALTVPENPKIMLVNPPFYRFITFSYSYNPLGLRYLASYLVHKGYSHIKIFNFDYPPEGTEPSGPPFPVFQENFGIEYKREMENPEHPVWKEVEATLRKEMPDIVGISSMTPQFEQAVYTASLAKAINPKCVTIIGGTHPTVMPEECLERGSIDIVCVGEGEETLYEIVKALEAGSDLAGVAGIGFRDGSGKAVLNERRELIQDLDALPFPSMDLQSKQERDFAVRRVSLLTGRGCPYQCTFCARKPIWGKKVRVRSADSVVSEIEYMYHTYGSRYFMFEDDTMTIQRDRVERIFALIAEKKLDITYTIQTRVNYVNDRLLSQLKKSGCVNIAIGVESGSQFILDRIKKQITLQQVQDAVKLIQKYGIAVSSFFIIGYPWETKEMIQETEDFIKKLDSDITHLYLLVPLPGSELYNEVRDSGSFIAKEWFYFFFQNPNVFRREHIDNEWLYERFKQMKKFIDDLRHRKARKKARSVRFVFQKFRENMTSPRKLVYLVKRFFKIQMT